MKTDMKAIVWQGEQRFQVQTVPAPHAADGRIVVKVEASAICGSDFHLGDFGITPPLIPGHEVAGVVSEIGRHVAGLSLGDRVALDPVQRCGTCWSCRHAIGHLCANTRHLGDHETPGGWAEYVAIDAVNAHRIPDGIDFSAACLAEPAAVCYESLMRARLQPRARVLIIGDGPFGFLHAQIARALGAETIVVAGHYDQRLRRIAEHTGAVTCNTHREDLDRVLNRAADSPGIDIAVEATGAGASPNIGIRALRPRGTLIVFSYIWKPEPLEMGLIHMRELNILGACRSLNAYAACLAMMAKGTLNTGALVDLRSPLTDCEKTLQHLAARKADIFKAVFIP